MGNNIIHGFLKLISAVQKLRCCSRWPSHNRKKLCKTHSKSISHAKLPFLSSLSLSSNQKMQCIGTHLDIHEILHATNEFKTVRVRLHKGHSGGTVQQGHSFFSSCPSTIRKPWHSVPQPLPLQLPQCWFTGPCNMALSLTVLPRNRKVHMLRHQTNIPASGSQFPR